MRRHDRRRKPRKAHVRHILVANKPEAKLILEQINDAKKPLRTFKKMAKKYSNCPSGSKVATLVSSWRVKWRKPSRMLLVVRTGSRAAEFHQNPIWISHPVGAQHRAS